MKYDMHAGPSTLSDSVADGVVLVNRREVFPRKTN